MGGKVAKRTHEELKKICEDKAKEKVVRQKRVAKRLTRKLRKWTYDKVVEVASHCYGVKDFEKNTQEPIQQQKGINGLKI